MELYLIIFIIFLCSHLTCNCPISCKCTKVDVQCKHNSLRGVPTDIAYDIRILDLSFNSIKNLSARSFEKFNHLKKLRLDHNDMKTIDENAFVGLESLRNLYLTNNDLSQLHPETFNKHLDKLLHVYLGFNEFENIPTLRATHMTKLNLDSNKIKSAVIDQSFLQNTGLQTIVLTKNNIKKIDEDDFKNLRNSQLLSLMLKFNDLEYIHPKAFEPVRATLKTLELEGNKLLNSSIIEAALMAFSGVSPMQFLDLRDTGLTYISENFFKPFANSKIHQLDISHNSKLVNISDNSFIGLESLQYLSMENCRIQSSKARFSAMGNLRELNMSHNLLLDCPFSLPGTLEVLDLSFNNIRRIRQTDFKSLSSLNYLDLNNNAITSIDRGSFFDLSGLKILELHGNRLEKIDEGVFTGIPRLLTLSLSRQASCLTSINGNAFVLPSLGELRLDSNCINLSGRLAFFRKLSNLRNLSLSSNQFERLHSQLLVTKSDGTSSIERIDLSRNKISSWEGETFLTVRASLFKLDLSFNNIVKVTTKAENMDNYLPVTFLKLQRVSLNSNRWNCSCNDVGWLLRYRKGLVDADNIICSTPLSLMGQKLLQALTSCKEWSMPIHISNSTSQNQKSSSSNVLKYTMLVIFIILSLTAGYCFRKTIRMLLKRLSNSLPRNRRYNRFDSPEINVNQYENPYGEECDGSYTAQGGRLEFSPDVDISSTQNNVHANRYQSLINTSEGSEEEDAQEEIFPEEVPDIVFISVKAPLEDTRNLSILHINDKKKINATCVVNCEILVIDYPWLDENLLIKLCNKPQRCEKTNYIFNETADEIEHSFSNIEDIVKYNSNNLVTLLKTRVK